MSDYTSVEWSELTDTKRAYKAKKPHIKAECKHCGAEFETCFPNKIFCSMECNSVFHRRKRAEKKRLDNLG